MPRLPPCRCSRPAKDPAMPLASFTRARLACASFFAASAVEMGAVGSLLLVPIGLNMLKVAKIKVMDLLPAIFLPIIFCLFL